MPGFSGVVAGHAAIDEQEYRGLPQGAKRIPAAQIATTGSNPGCYGIDRDATGPVGIDQELADFSGRQIALVGYRDHDRAGSVGLAIGGRNGFVGDLHPQAGLHEGKGRLSGVIVIPGEEVGVLRRRDGAGHRLGQVLRAGRTTAYRGVGQIEGIRQRPGRNVVEQTVLEFEDRLEHRFDQFALPLPVADEKGLPGGELLAIGRFRRLIEQLYLDIVRGQHFSQFPGAADVAVHTDQISAGGGILVAVVIPLVGQ